MVHVHTVHYGWCVCLYFSNWNRQLDYLKPWFGGSPVNDNEPFPNPPASNGSERRGKYTHKSPSQEKNFGYFYFPIYPSFQPYTSTCLTPVKRASVNVN